MIKKDVCGCKFDHTEHGSYLIGEPVCEFHKKQEKTAIIDGIVYKREVY